MICFCLMLGGAAAAPAALQPDPSLGGFPLLTNLHQLRQFALKQSRGLCSVRLEAVVRAANTAMDGLVLEDDGRAELLELELSGRRYSPGDRVRLEAQGCSVMLGRLGLLIGKAAVVDNDGIHSMVKKSGDVYLGRGLYPLRLLWFNNRSGLGLNVRYSGPGIDRQKVPGSLLFRAECDPATGRSNIVQGLDYRCYQGDWLNLSSGFGSAKPVKTGHAPDFDVGLRSREEQVGLEFSGYLESAREGLYTFETESDDGSQLYIAEAAPSVARLGTSPLAGARQLVASQVLLPEDECQWAEVDGTVTFASETCGGLDLELRHDTRRMRVLVADASGLTPSSLLYRRIRAAGVSRGAQSVEGPRILALLTVLSGADISRGADEPTETEGLSLLTSGEQVKRLTREEAGRGNPVRIRGVITRAVPGFESVVIQDATRGVFVWGVPRWSPGAPHLGEYWEIEGVTAPGDFAPVVHWRQGRRLGVGRLPEPVLATWDQLVNGSLDTQYVEIQGVATAAGAHHLDLFLRDGKITLGFLDREGGTLNRYENARIRVRGCLFPSWNRATHRVNFGRVNIASAIICVEEAAPAEVFSAPAKRAAELLLFDAGAGAFQRVKVAGQFLGATEGYCFMNDGTGGVRFQPRGECSFQPGDLIEVVGYLELGSPSPLLRQTVARKTGHAALPKPQPLGPETWLDAAHDATRVSVDGLLINRRMENAEQVLELQAGWRNLLARLSAKEKLPQSLPVGSRLRLTGTYAAQGGSRTQGGGLESFELLLGSAADLRVLARPPWLTLPRVLAALGVVGAILLGALLWALSLRHRVSAQTAIIREKAQREAALEERARIAKDIHDDVGASLTSIIMLGERSREDLDKPRELAAHTGRIVTYARATVQALDEIVWAVNPQNDTLDALVGYVNQYSSQFFECTSVHCRLEAPEKLFSSLVLPAKVRHDLFLVVKEALNNVLKHAQASEVKVAMREAGRILEIAIEDNGRGFDTATAAERSLGDGLKNMRKRMERIGGGFSLASVPGQGTRLQLTAPLDGQVLGA